MISFLEKWLYTEETGLDPSSEFSLNESEAGDWLLIDVELINSEGEFLSDYVVVPVIRQEDESPLARQKNEAVSKSLKNIKKCQKIFHGKMISRICARGLAHPYCIERPLGFKAAISEAEDMRNVERLKQLGFWLETMMIKVPRSLSTLGNSLTVSRVRVQSLKFPVAIQVEGCKQVMKPMKLQSKHAHWLLDDLNTCKSVVKYEPSPVKELLSDLQNFTRKRSFDFAAKIGDARQQSVARTVDEGEMCRLVDLSLRKRSKSNSTVKLELPCVGSPLVVSEPKPSPVPLLALEWVEQQQQCESQTNDHESQQHDEDSNWLRQPAISMICDICEMTSQIGHRVPKVAVFLWAQFMQLLSRGRKYLCRKQDDDNARDSTEITREPTRECYFSLSCKDFSENKNRAVAEKKTKRHDTKKTLKRAHAAMVQMHSHNTNRKRAMNCAKFRRENGRRGY